MRKKLGFGMILMASMMLFTGCGADGSVAQQEVTTAQEAENTEEDTQETTQKATTESVMERKQRIKDEYEQGFKPAEGFMTPVEGREYGERVEIEYQSKTTGTTRKANIILPVGYDKSQTYPVLYLLHGIGGDETEWFQGKPIEIIGNLQAEEAVVPFITVVPNVRARANDHDISDIYQQTNFSAFDNFINDLRDDLMPYMQEHYNIYTDREHTAICGLSMGGMESLNIGFSMLDTFGYIGAFSPAPTLNTALLTLEGSEYVPYHVMICCGDSDSVVTEVPKGYHEVLEANGVEHVWYQYPDGDHNFTVWNDGLYNFVKNIFKEESK